MSKYVEYFQAEVSGWQKKLMVADLVISSWMSVQRTWAHLNSIFTNSHDIRCQLASDAERFQGIHSDFQVLCALEQGVLLSGSQAWSCGDTALLVFHLFLLFELEN